MASRHFSDEDLKALLGYIASNPAILFPTLTKKERENLIRDVLDQYDAMSKAEDPKTPDANLIVKAMVYNDQKRCNFDFKPSGVNLFIGDAKQS